MDKQQTFNDGILTVYAVGNIALPGTQPKQGLTKKVGPLRFEERIVGMGRFWDASQSNVKISQILRTPRINSVSTQDVVLANGEQFKILQIQYIPDVEPKSMDLSLERTVAKYDIETA